MAQQEKGWFLSGEIVRGILVGPENTREVLIPLNSETSCVLPKNGLEGPVISLIALGMVGSRVQLADPQELAHILHEIRE